MKLLKQLFMHLDGVYFELQLTDFEKQWFALQTKYKFSHVLLNDPDSKESNTVYLKIKNSTSDFSVATLQQVLTHSVKDKIISLEDSNQLISQACQILSTMVPHFKKHEQFFKIADKTNLTTIVLSEIEKFECKIDIPQKEIIDEEFQRHFIQIQNFPTSILMRILDALDNDTRCPYDNNLLIKNISDRFKIQFSELKGESLSYLHQLLRKYIREISELEDVIGLAFARNDSYEKIIQLMNIVWRARNRDRDQQMINGDFYDEEDHAKALKYFINEKNMLPKQAISEILNLNFSKTNSLISLYDHGLRRKHLMDYEESHVNFSNFYEIHGKALTYLIKEKQFSPEKAIAEINQLPEHQVEVLLELFDEGLRGEHLRTWSEGLDSNSHFFGAHRFALIYLVKEQHLTPIDALKEIHKLSGSAADAIFVFYALGLRGKDLQNWREKGQFDSWDYEALCKWMDLGLKGEDISIHRVLDEMQKMSRQDIRDIAIGVKSPPEVKGYGLSR